jgi:hypothetical protein
MRHSSVLEGTSVLITCLHFTDTPLYARGLIEGEDAPDIVANTFLDRVSEEQLQEIGYSFLDHRECL